MSIDSAGIPRGQWRSRRALSSGRYGDRISGILPQAGQLAIIRHSTTEGGKMKIYHVTFTAFDGDDKARSRQIIGVCASNATEAKCLAADDLTTRGYRDANITFCYATAGSVTGWTFGKTLLYGRV